MGTIRWVSALCCVMLLPRMYRFLGTCGWVAHDDTYWVSEQAMLTLMIATACNLKKNRPGADGCENRTPEAKGGNAMVQIRPVYRTEPTVRKLGIGEACAHFFGLPCPTTFCYAYAV